MNVLRTAVESLTLVMLWITRAAFMAQGLALAMTALLSSSMSSGARLPWASATMGPLLLIAGTFGLGGIALHLLSPVAVRGYSDPQPVDRPLEGATPDIEPAPPPSFDVATSPPPGMPPALAWCLLLVPAATLFLSADLFVLWREILDALRRLGIFSSSPWSDSMSGLVLAPVLVGVYVPALQAFTAIFLRCSSLGRQP